MGQVTPEEKDDGVVEEPSTPVKQRPASKAKTPKSKSPKAKSPKGKTPKKEQAKAKAKGRLFEKACCQWRNRTAKEEASSSWLGSRVAGGSGGGSTRS